MDRSPAQTRVIVLLVVVALTAGLSAGCAPKPTPVTPPPVVTKPPVVTPPVITEPTSPPAAQTTETTKPKKPPAQGGYASPKIGSAERVAMMDALRASLKRPDLIFLVPDLRMKDGWAFASVSPQTKDGKTNLEGLDVLWAGSGSSWSVKRVMGLNGEDDWMQYDSAGGLAKFWTGKYPAAPPQIFPGK
jgi:hypothetical protein